MNEKMRNDGKEQQIITKNDELYKELKKNQFSKKRYKGEQKMNRNERRWFEETEQNGGKE